PTHSQKKATCEDGEAAAECGRFFFAAPPWPPTPSSGLSPNLAPRYTRGRERKPRESFMAVLLTVIVSWRSRFQGLRAAVGAACGRRPFPPLEAPLRHVSRFRAIPP